MRNHKDKAGRNQRLHKNRRELLRLSGICLLGSSLTTELEGAEEGQPKFKVLNENDRIDIGDKADEFIEKAYKLGFDLEKKHGGCCQCIVATLQNAIEFIPEDKALFRAASCLDGGATPKGVQNCGAFTGAGMLIGWVCGNEEFGNTKLSHKLIRQVYGRFEKDYGSVLCKDVREKMNANCPEVVGRAARWAAEVLLRRFTNYEQEERS